MAGDIYISFGADTGDLEAAFALAKAQTNALAAEMRSLAVEMASTGAAADSELAGRLTAVGAQFAAAKAQTAGLKDELRGVGASGASGLAGLLAPITAIRESISGFVELFAAAFAVEKIREFISAMGEIGEQTERTSKILGLTTEQVGELQYAFAATGTDSGNLDQMMGRFEVSLAKAAAGTGPALAGLKALGLSAKDLVGVPLPEQLAKIADATSHFADGVNKTAALQSLGRGFVELIPLLDQGATGFDKLRETADATNSVLSEGVTAQLVEMQHGFVELGAAIKGLAIEAFTPFVGVVTNAVGELTQLAEAFSDSIKNGGPLSILLEGVAVAMRVLLTYSEAMIGVTAELLYIGSAAYAGLRDAVLGYGQVVGDVFRELAAAIPGFFTALVAAGKEAVAAVEQQFIDLGTVIGDTLKLNFAGAREAMGSLGTDAAASAGKISGAFSGVFDFSKAETDAKAATDKIAQDVATGGQRMVASAEETAKRLKDIWGLGGQGAAVAPPTAQVGNLDTTVGSQAKAAADAVKHAFSEEVQTAQDAEKSIEASLNNELKLHQITTSQWLAGTNAALDAEALAIITADQKAEASAQLTSQQKIAIADREANALTAIAKKEADAQIKANDDILKSYQDAGNEILSAWNSNLRGLLSGTESWHQAMLKIAQDLTIKVIEWAEKAVVQWVVGELAKTAATNAGAAARTAAGAGEASAGIAMDAMTAIKSIITSAGEAFAGVFGFLAPVMGPAAAAPAAAAEGMVMGKAGMVASADIGMWQVPGDQMAMIHRNELIMPAAQAGAFRNMLSGAAATGGGGASVSANVAPQFHVHAMDAQTVAATLMGNRAAIVKAVGQAVRDGAHHGVRGLRFA